MLLVHNACCRFHLLCCDTSQVDDFLHISIVSRRLQEALPISTNLWKYCKRLVWMLNGWLTWANCRLKNRYAEGITYFNNAMFLFRPYLPPLVSHFQYPVFPILFAGGSNFSHWHSHIDPWRCINQPNLAPFYGSCYWGMYFALLSSQCDPVFVHRWVYVCMSPSSDLLIPTIPCSFFHMECMLRCIMISPRWAIIFITKSLPIGHQKKWHPIITLKITFQNVMELVLLSPQPMVILGQTVTCLARYHLWLWIWISSLMLLMWHLTRSVAETEFAIGIRFGYRSYIGMPHSSSKNNA